MNNYKFLLSLLFSFIISQDTMIDSISVKNPSIAWKMSLLPGMGQIYNEKYIKSTLFLSSISYAYLKKSEYSLESKVARRNTYSWWIFGLYVWGILDAYVDAHLSTFPTDEINYISNKEK